MLEVIIVPSSVENCFFIFETCCFLKLYDICSKVYTFLSSRKNIDGLYMFKDGTIRVDITIHVLNGIRQLCS